MAQTLVANAREAMRAIEAYDQATVDRLCRAIAWAGGNEATATRLARMSVDESGMGSPEPKRRAKVLGILRDAGYRGWLVVEGEQDPAVAPAYRYADMGYRLLSALVAGKTDTEARAAARVPDRMAA